LTSHRAGNKLVFIMQTVQLTALR